MYNIIEEMYENLDHSLDSRELCAVTYKATFDNFVHCSDYGIILWSKYINDKLIERRGNELHFHNFLKHQLFSKLQEIKYYSNVNIADTRRLVAVSPDCISTIQILVRDKIYLNVYFRSSDIDGALPADLRFITELPTELIVHLERMREAKGYSEITDELMKDLRSKPIELTLMFGSLHRTV
jgi:hypothetical protein